MCETTPIEIFSVLARRESSGVLASSNAATIRVNFLNHTNQRYLVQLIESSILLQARLLVTNHKLRTLDAIQLASAIHAATILGEPLIFLSGDIDLLTAASNEGFVVDNPNAHP